VYLFWWIIPQFIINLNSLAIRVISMCIHVCMSLSSFSVSVLQVQVVTQFTPILDELWFTPAKIFRFSKHSSGDVFGIFTPPSKGINGFSHPEDGGSSSSWMSGKTCTTRRYRHLNTLPPWKFLFFKDVFKTDKSGICPKHGYFSSDLNEAFDFKRFLGYVVWIMCIDISVDTSAPIRINICSVILETDYT